MASNPEGFYTTHIQVNARNRTSTIMMAAVQVSTSARWEGAVVRGRKSEAGDAVRDGSFCCHGCRRDDRVSFRERHTMFAIAERLLKVFVVGVGGL